MNNITNNLDYLKNIIEKRETYIRFSPIWTWIMWIMYIIYYFFRNNICSSISNICTENNLFLIIWITWFILVTLLSLINSKKRKENILPKSIRYIIGNLVFIWITFFALFFRLYDTTAQYIIPISFLFYWLLIIVSRASIQYFIKYFWYTIFLSWLLMMWPLSNYTNEFVLLVMWLWHLIIFVLLKTNNDKNG